jgi:hypothetical protein
MLREGSKGVCFGLAVRNLRKSRIGYSKRGNGVLNWVFVCKYWRLLAYLVFGLAFGELVFTVTELRTDLSTILVCRFGY